MAFSVLNWGSLKKVLGGAVPPPSTGALEAENSNKTDKKTPPQRLPLANQSDDNVGVSVTRLPPTTPLEGPALLNFAAAASMQQEMSVSKLFPSPANFLPVTSVTINRNEKNEAKYMTD
eukprot:11751985-Ditylum_brightwellii.AAC.1